MKIFKPKFWTKKYISVLAILFLPISIIIQLLLFIKKFISTQNKFSVPVFCVGNIYLGGTGKTPVSIKISEILTKLNKKPAIIKKFYKNQFDEIYLIKSKFNNIFSDVSRIKAINRAIEEKFNTIVLDDGFQDYTIKKDANILCFNQNQLIGNGLTIPSGPLRENLSSVKNSQIIIINGNPEKKFENKIRHFSKRTKIFYCKYVPSNISKFRGKKLAAFAGIGNPNNFFNLLEKHNLKVLKRISFPDHYIYSEQDIKKLLDLTKKDKLNLITTEKDYFRLKSLGYKKKIDYLSIKIKFNKEKKLIQELRKYL